MSDVVLGRDSEQQRLSRFLESLQEGPAACLLEGEAGIGKTALWRDAVARAQAASFRVLSCAPAEAEAALSYSALADLLADVEPEIMAALPAPQRDSLHVALLSADRATQPSASARSRQQPSRCSARSLRRLLCLLPSTMSSGSTVRRLVRSSSRPDG